MSSGGGEGFINAIFGMPRFAPAWFSAFLLGLGLLFVQELPEPVRRYLLPALLVYSLGAALIGALHRLLGLHYVPAEGGNNEKPIPWQWKLVVLLLHAAWFAVFLGYISWRGVL